jgi:glycosyltransferase involved in cell wall biosynthesis
VIITIVTPSLNGAEFLRECIESVRTQQTAGVEVEHVLVDGGSTDGTCELAASLGAVVMTREERSPYAALNKGSFASSGTFLGALGCDDVLLPGALAAVARGDELSGARWVIGKTQWYDGRSSRGTVPAPPRWLTAPVYASLGWSCIPHPSTFVRRDLFEELGGFDPSFVYAGDYDFFARLLQRREPFDAIGRPLCAWRRDGSNLSMSPDPARQAEIDRVRDRYAPGSPTRRAFYRGALKVWLNGTNPKWFACKRIDAYAARARHWRPAV